MNRLSKVTILAVTLINSAYASGRAVAEPSTTQCDIVKERVFAGEGVRLVHKQGFGNGGNFALFKAPLAVNTDGAPTSYHPEDFTGTVRALNRIDNGIIIRNKSQVKMTLQEKIAIFNQWRSSPDWRVPDGYTISWKNVIAADAKGHPCVFKQENAGYFGSLTALKNGLSKSDAGECEVKNQLDQRLIPAIVLRGADNPLKQFGAKVGDLVVVENPENNVVVSAVIGDTGDGGRIGEGSIALNMALLKSPAMPQNYTQAKKLDTGNHAMIVTVLPGSAGFERERPYSAANIAERVKHWAIQHGYGSVDGLVTAARNCSAGL